MAVNIKRWLGSDPVEFLLRIIVGITVVVCLGLFVRQNNLSSCQYKYNQAYAEYATDARSIRDQDDKVRDELFHAIYDARNLDSNAAQKAIDAAFVKYFTTIDITNKQRIENPAPSLPSSYCG